MSAMEPKITMNMTAPMEVGLSVSDMAAMVKFYQAAFGLSIESDVSVPATLADAAALSAGAYRVVRMQTLWGERIKLLASENPPIVSAVPDGHILDHHPAVYITFIVDDLRSVMATAIGAGAMPITGPEPVEVRPGTFLAFLRDPEGHIIEIVEYSDVTAYRPDLAEKLK